MPFLAGWAKLSSSSTREVPTLQYAAGHDNIERTVRYVQPQANAVRTLFARLAALQE
jgi:hypothetical protein